MTATEKLGELQECRVKHQKTVSKEAETLAGAERLARKWECHTAEAIDLEAAHRARREIAAREAFYGAGPNLMRAVLEARGYEMDGVRHPANGCTLAECIETVTAMPRAEYGAAHEADKPVRNMHCSCCGSECRGRQWHNRDTGYGLCPKCAEWLGTRETAEEMRNTYGVPGVNYAIPGEM